MSNWYVNKENLVTICLGSYGVYGKESGFKLYYRYSTDDTLTKSDVSFKEEKEDISDPVNVKADGDTNKGSTQIKVDDASDVKKGMRYKVKDKDIYFYVEDVDTDNNILTTRYKTTDDIKDGDELDQVGNTGTYSAKLTFSSTGSIIIMVRHIDLDIDFEPTVIEVTDEIPNIKSNVDLLKLLETCKMEIKDNKLHYYDSDGNEVLTFKLYDKDGNGTDTDVYKREPS